MDNKEKSSPKQVEKNGQVDYKNFEYEFLFKINDDIICQRLFDIRMFDKESLKNFNVKYAVDEAVELINADLRDKTRVYLMNVCSPRDNEEQERGKTIQLQSGVRGDGSPVITDYNDFWIVSEKSSEFVPVRDERSIFETYKVYDERFGTYGFYNKPKVVDGVKTFKHVYDNEFSFTFKIKGVPVVTKIWSADDYPSFIRSSVDIANKKVFMGVNESPMSYELRKKISENRKDLIYEIIAIFRNYCSKYNK